MRKYPAYVEYVTNFVVDPGPHESDCEFMADPYSMTYLRGVNLITFVRVLAQIVREAQRILSIWGCYGHLSG